MFCYSDFQIFYLIFHICQSNVFEDYRSLFLSIAAPVLQRFKKHILTELWENENNKINVENFWGTIDGKLSV